MPSGLGVLSAAFFIVGETAGVGVLSLPQAITFCQSTGFILMGIMCGLSCYTAVELGNCWIIVRKHYADCAPGAVVREPYPLIAEKCFGKPGRYFIAVCIDLVLFGACVVFIVLAGTLLSQIFVNFLNLNITFCLFMPIFALLLTPITWFGSPKDFAIVALFASLGTIIACFIMVVDTFWAIPLVPQSERGYIAPMDPNDFFMSIGTIAFAFSGHPCFPTIINDMKYPAKFNISAMVGYARMQFLVLLFEHISSSKFIIGVRELESERTADTSFSKLVIQGTAGLYYETNSRTSFKK